MCLSPRQVARKDIYGSWHVVTVNCGHCWECVRKRQNEMAALVVRESEFRGALLHVTFSYAPAHLPMYYVQRFWDAETGLYLGHSDPKRISQSTELFHDSRDYLLLSRSDKLFLRQVRAPRRKKLRSSILSINSLTKTEQERADLCVGKRSTLKLREDLIRAEYIRRFGRRECRRELLLDSRFSPDGKLLVETEVRPSISRRDVSLYLKRERVRYERENGHKLPKFTYNVIGELGPKNGRPHFHMCVCAKSEDLGILQDWLFCSSNTCSNYLNSWHYLIGNVKCKRVTRYTKGQKNKDGFEAAGKYIGKYLAKGQEFEEQNVVDGLVERPRRCCSANFGVGDLSQLRHYHLCWDLFGQYDVQNVSTYPKDKSALVDWVLSRMYLIINGHKYPIPRRIKQLLFYKDVFKSPRSASARCRSSFVLLPDSEADLSATSFGPLPDSRWQVVKRASVLSRMVSSRVQENITTDYFSKLRSFTGKSLQETSHLDRLAFEDGISLAARQRSNSIAASQYKFLQKSVF